MDEPQKPLQPLDEFNAARHRQIARAPLSFNGIACPKCGMELHDSEPGVILTTYPAQVRITCSACGFNGCRIK